MMKNILPFADYTRERPGCFFFVGTGEKDSKDPNAWHTASGMHSSTFDFNDRILNLISSMWIRLLEYRFGIALCASSSASSAAATATDRPSQDDDGAVDDTTWLMPRIEAFAAVAECGDSLGTYTPGRNRAESNNPN